MQRALRRTGRAGRRARGSGGAAAERSIPTAGSPAPPAAAAAEEPTAAASAAPGAAAPTAAPPAPAPDPFLAVCRWFDRECASYLRAEDVEEILLYTSDFLSRARLPAALP